MSIVTYPQDYSHALPLGFCCSPTIRKINRTKFIMWKDKVSERLKQKQWKRSLGSHKTNKGIACSVKHTLDPHVRYKAYIWPQYPVSSQPGNIWPLLPLNENRCLPSFDKQALAREIRSCFVLVFFFFWTSTLAEVISCKEWTRAIKRPVRLVGLSSILNHEVLVRGLCEGKLSSPCKFFSYLL